jgi:hypothetical protein
MNRNMHGPVGPAGGHAGTAPTDTRGSVSFYGFLAVP